MLLPVFRTISKKLYNARGTLKGTNFWFGVLEDFQSVSKENGVTKQSDAAQMVQFEENTC